MKSDSKSIDVTQGLLIVPRIRISVKTASQFV